MSLTFNLTIHDLFKKLKNDASALENEFTSDSFINFVFVGYSMIDWVKNDSTIPRSARAAVSSLYSDKWITICGDIATVCKHCTITSRRPITSTAILEDGFGVGGWGKGGYGVGEQDIKICLNDGTVCDGLELVRNVCSSWGTFFSDHNI